MLSEFFIISTKEIHEYSLHCNITTCIVTMIVQLLLDAKLRLSHKDHSKPKQILNFYSIPVLSEKLFPADNQAR